MLTLKSANYEIEDFDMLGRSISKALQYLYETNGCTNMGAHCPTCGSKRVCEDLNKLNVYIVEKMDFIGLPY